MTAGTDLAGTDDAGTDDADPDNADPDNYVARWGWDDAPRTSGLTAVVRVRDEARCLPWSLPGVLAATTRVVLVDNASTDGTTAVARRVAAAAGAADRLDCLAYPFDVARCGPEHLDTPSTSVHSLTHFYNWAFSHVRTALALKWDGDMVLTERGVATIRDLAWQLEGVEAIVDIPRHPLHVVDERRAYFDVGFVNREQWIWPNRPEYVFAKGIDFELSPAPWGVERLVLPQGLCFEVKFLDTDEFAGWSTHDFGRHHRNKRKRREWEVWCRLRDGDVPEGIVTIESPPGVHVVDHVRDSWLPQQPQPVAHE